MTRLELDPKEQEVLRDLLQNDLSDLRMEVADTDSYDYRQILKEQEEILRRILGRLEPGAGLGQQEPSAPSPV